PGETLTRSQQPSGEPNQPTNHHCIRQYHRPQAHQADISMPAIVGNSSRPSETHSTLALSPAGFASPCLRGDRGGWSADPPKKESGEIIRDPLTYSTTQPLNHSPTHQLANSPTRQLTQSPTHQLTSSFSS